MKKILPLLLFCLVSCIDILGVLLENPSIRYGAKPLIMLSLIWYYVSNTKFRNKLFVFGMFFSFLGDVFLLSKEEFFFILGLGSFLIAHLCYIAMILKYLEKPTLPSISKALFPYLLVFIVLMQVLYSSLGAMKIPVIIYAFTISVFGMLSLLYYFQNKNTVARILVFGVLLFIISDSILALNLFYSPKSFFPVLIMSTYVGAQFLICKFVLNLKLEA